MTRLSFLAISQASDIGDVAVVIDVLRAFTTAAWAFELGVQRIVMTDDLDEALRLKGAIAGALAMKDGEPAPGFELVNSPVMLRERQDLAGRTIVQRTTHGTVGAWAARGASSLYCASFACASATARALAEAEDVSFVVSGEDGTADEDLACAEYIAALLEDARTPAGPYVARVATSVAAGRLAQRVRDGSLGTHPGDVEACMEADRFGFAMRARVEDGLLVLRRVEV